MSYLIKQSSSSRPLLFLMIDSADHVTGKTGLSLTVTISKNGGAFAAPGGAVTELSGGWYKVAGNATDSNALGPLLLHATATGADPCDVQYEVVAFDPEDGVRAGLTALPNSVAGANAGLPLGNASGHVTIADGSLVTAKLGTFVLAKTTNLTGFNDLSAAQVNAEADTAASDYGALKPTVAGRTLDVSAGGEAGLDWANIGGNTTAVNLSGTTFKAVTDGVTVATINADVVNASALAADAVAEIQNGLATAATQTTILNRIGAFTGSGVNTILGLFKALLSKAATLPSDVGGTFDPATDSTEALRDRGDAAWITATGFSTLNAGGVTAAVWDASTTGHTTGGTFGAAMNAAGSAGDPWGTTLPGPYAAGTAGNIVGNRLDVAVGSRMATFTYTAPDNATIAAINAKTANLPNDPADASDIAAAFATVNGNIPSAAAVAAAVWANGSRTITGGTVTAITGLTIGSVENAAARFLGMVELSAGLYRFTVAALANAPAGGGGGGTQKFITTENKEVRS